MIYPVITLYQPWATWIIRGWKPIETRTHERFACLLDKRILFHAGLITDLAAFNNPYLTKEQFSIPMEEFINGAILGMADVYMTSPLHPSDAQQALIECVTPRYGLFLREIEVFDEPIPEKGSMGIWYYDLEKREKVVKPKKQTKLFEL